MDWQKTNLIDRIAFERSSFKLQVLIVYVLPSNVYKFDTFPIYKIVHFLYCMNEPKCESPQAAGLLTLLHEIIFSH